MQKVTLTSSCMFWVFHRH